MTHRPDYSEYVAHFTSGSPLAGDPNLAGEINPLTPIQRLRKILIEKRIRGTKKFFGLGGPSAAFTECPWTSLIVHAMQYSSFGIGFTKQQLWAKGGQPAVYLRSEILHSMKEHVEEEAGHTVYRAIPPDFGSFYTPFEREAGWRLLGGQEMDTHVDFAHEREWRVPGDFVFDYEDVQFLIVDRFSDTQHLPHDVLNIIGEGSILSMSNYTRILQLWPG